MENPSVGNSRLLFLRIPRGLQVTGRVVSGALGLFSGLIQDHGRGLAAGAEPRGHPSWPGQSSPPSLLDRAFLPGVPLVPASGWTEVCVRDWHLLGSENCGASLGLSEFVDKPSALTRGGVQEPRG